MLRRMPGPTQYNTDHHEVIIRPSMQNHSSTNGWGHTRDFTMVKRALLW